MIVMMLVVLTGPGPIDIFGIWGAGATRAAADGEAAVIQRGNRSCAVRSPPLHWLRSVVGDVDRGVLVR